MTDCPKDNKRCYIKRDPVTDEEISCRHYNLINRGGICPELEEICNSLHSTKKE